MTRTRKRETSGYRGAVSLKSRGIAYESDFDGEAYVNLIAPSAEDSVNGLDVERFIFSLPLNDTVALLFTALGYERSEIRELLGYQSVASVNQMFMRLRKACIDNNFTV